jgi:hypothetical protein
VHGQDEAARWGWVQNEKPAFDLKAKTWFLLPRFTVLRQDEVIW